jgi:hypothetical protein
VVLATSDADGGDYGLISSMVVWCGYSGAKKGDTGYLGGRRYLPETGHGKLLLHAECNGICGPFGIIQLVHLFSKPLAISDSLAESFGWQFLLVHNDPYSKGEEQ